MIRRTEDTFLVLQAISSRFVFFVDFIKFFLFNRVEFDLIEFLQQPWLGEVGLGSIRL